VAQDAAIKIDDIDSPYSTIPSLKAAIYARGFADGQPEKAPVRSASSVTDVKEELVATPIRG